MNVYPFVFLFSIMVLTMSFVAMRPFSMRPQWIDGVLGRICAVATFWIFYSGTTLTLAQLN